MMKKLISELTTLPISMLNLNGTSKVRALKIITKELNERYGKTFIVDSLRVGLKTENNNIIKACCYETSNMNEMFKAALKDDSSIVIDEYQALCIEKQLEAELKSLCDEKLGQSFVDLNLINEMTSDNAKYSDFKDYFIKNKHARSSISIYIKTVSEINKDEESQKISEFLKAYSELRWRTGSMSIFFLHNDEFEKIQEQYKDIENEFDYYGTSERSYNYIWMDFWKTDIVELEHNEIKNKFIW